MPLASPWIGNGWGWVAPPMPKQQHPVAFMQQNPDQPIALPGFYDQNNLPPKRADGQPAQGGELLIVHQSGTRIEIRNDQKMLVNGQIEIDLTSMTINITATDTVNITAATTVNVTAPSVNLGTSQGGLQTLMTKAAHDILAQHTHPGTGPMTQALPSNSLTTAVQAD